MNLSWIDAIVKVMEENGAAMHYTDIAEKIISQELRDKIGATPAATVSYNLSTSINNDGSKSPFIRLGRGEYILKESTTQKNLQGRQGLQEIIILRPLKKTSVL